VGLLSTVQETGMARIIVTLKMPEQPDDGLAGTAAVKEQRTQINQLQWQFFRELNPSLEGDISGTLEAAGVHNFRTIPAVAMEVGFDSLTSIQNNDLVDSVEIDVPHPPTLSDSTSIIGAVDGDGVWQLDYSGAGQTVAVLDTGVDKTHPDLADKVVSEACYSTTSSAHEATSVCPNGKEEQIGNDAGVACSGASGCDHGTHVAGIVAANGSIQGVAKDADIIAIQVFSIFNSSQYCGLSAPCVLSYTSDQIAGLERVLALYEDGMDNIASVNMSLGGGNYPDVCNGAIQGVIDNLREAGIATIVSSGNNGYKDGIASPACISSAISVGATTKSDTVPDYSNSADTLDLLAPGSYIRSTLPGGSTGPKSGTSMAAPHVAGAFAVLKSAAPDASVDQILNILKQTGVSVTDTRNSITKPRINLTKALERIAPSADEPNIEVTPTSHNLGNVILGDSSTVTVTISNTGNSDLEIGQLSLGGTDFVVNNDTCSNTTVAVNNNCTVTITFTPATEGVKTTKLLIPSNDPDIAVTKVSLTGKGLTDVVLIPEIAVTPTSHNFGYVKVGHSSTVTVKISNTGNSDLEIGQLKLGGWNFEMINDNCSNTSITAGQHCNVTIT
ncbi:MAG: S8 family serine peptidase, partial [Candidatus Parabeggiatoa sp.]|nr:S8 family serine peptidase [Candidatus Parabeggiatoa sp.]